LTPPAAHLVELMRGHAVAAGLNLSVAECDAVVGAYGAPPRHYHGLGHLDFLCTEASRHEAVIADVDLVRMAIWFHDAVYDAAGADNEARSAAWARQALHQRADLAARVGALIEKTANHFATEANFDEALFLDMDIAILGASAPDYAAYAAGVRAEYGHLDDARWRTGRGGFLQRVLERPSLFRTPAYRDALEPQARLNLAAELAGLSPP
jgi:predicted metal-dependent HD superfamily phosphohydrolase